jgi:hypothetical protein
MNCHLACNLLDIGEWSWQFRHRCAVAVFLLLGSLAPIQTRADPLDMQEKALKLINDTADRICNVIKTRGSSHSVKVTGDITAELTGLASKLADVGVKGAGKFRDAQFRGVLQNEVASSVHDSAKCKLKVFEDLQAKLVQPVSDEPADHPKPE